MKSGKEFNILNKCFAFVLVCLFSTVGAFATENSLSGVDIKQSSGNGYQLFLKLDKKAQIKKIVENQDNITLVVNSTLPSESMEIIYDSEDNLSNVIVQKKNDSNTLISLQGQNIANAEIFTKELSTGVIKTLDSNENFLSGLFFVVDKKIIGSSIVAMFLFFLMMFMSKPRNKRHSMSNANNISKSKQGYANTLRNKNLVQSRNIPSINYRHNGSFSSVNMRATTPKEFVINNQKQMVEKEQIRKAG